MNSVQADKLIEVLTQTNEALGGISSAIYITAAIVMVFVALYIWK